MSKFRPGSTPRNHRFLIEVPNLRAWWPQAASAVVEENKHLTEGSSDHLNLKCPVRGPCFSLLAVTTHLLEHSKKVHTYVKLIHRMNCAFSPANWWDLEGNAMDHRSSAVRKVQAASSWPTHKEACGSFRRTLSKENQFNLFPSRLSSFTSPFTWG